MFNYEWRNHPHVIRPLRRIHKFRGPCDHLFVCVVLDGKPMHRRHEYPAQVWRVTNLKGADQHLSSQRRPFGEGCPPSAFGKFTISRKVSAKRAQDADFELKD